MRTIIGTIVLAVALTACAAPAPQVIEVPGPTVEVPGPTVYALPEACIDYILFLEELEQLRIDAYNALLAGESPNVDHINDLNSQAPALATACVEAAYNANATPLPPDDNVPAQSS